MAHETAKQLLQQAGTFPQRTEAVRQAILHGMPLDEIEAYLDWLDTIRPGLPLDGPDDNLPPADSGEGASPSPGS